MMRFQESISDTPIPINARWAFVLNASLKGISVTGHNPKSKTEVIQGRSGQRVPGGGGCSRPGEVA